MKARCKKVLAVVSALSPVALFAQTAPSAPDLTTVATGAQTLFYGAAAVGVAIIVFRIGKKALTKGI